MKNIAASGMKEELNEVKLILDDLVLQTDRHEEIERAETTALRGREEDILGSGVMVRNYAVLIQQNSDGDNRNNDGGGEWEGNLEEDAAIDLDAMESTTSGIDGTNESNLKRRCR